LIRQAIARKLSLKKFINKKFFRFVGMGAANTLLSYGLYISLLQLFSYQIAYSVSYLLGILISYYLNTVFVFKSTFSFSKAFKYPAVYVIQYLLGVMLLVLLVELLNVSTYIAPLAVIIMTLPVTYYLSRKIIEGSNGG